MENIENKIKKYIEHYSKEMDRINIIQEFILKNENLKEYDTELLSRLTFPIIEELGFCLLGEDGLRTDKDGNKLKDKNTTKCIGKVLKEILDIKDDVAVKALINCFRHSLIHQSHAKLKFLDNELTYFVSYSVGLSATGNDIIEINPDNCKSFHFRVNDLIYHLNSKLIKQKILDELQNNQLNFLFVFNYDKRYVA